MALLILLSGSSFGFIEHSCSLKGRKTYVFFTASKKCCPAGSDNKKSDKTTVKKQACCTDKTVKTQKADQSNSESYSKKLTKESKEFGKSLIDWAVFKISSFIYQLFHLPAIQDDPQQGVKIFIFLKNLRL